MSDIKIIKETCTDKPIKQLCRMLNNEEILSFFIMAREREKTQKHISGELVYGLPHLFMFNTEHDIMPKENDKRLQAIDYELYAYWCNVTECLIEKYQKAHTIKDKKEARKKFIEMINTEDVKCWF